jgi:hypothetical protein
MRICMMSRARESDMLSPPIWCLSSTAYLCSFATPTPSGAQFPTRPIRWLGLGLGPLPIEKTTQCAPQAHHRAQRHPYALKVRAPPLSICRRMSYDPVSQLRLVLFPCLQWCVLHTISARLSKDGCCFARQWPCELCVTVVCKPRHPTR